MLNYLLLFSSVLLGASKNIFTKKVKNGTDSLYDVSKSNVFSFSVAFITIFLLYIFNFGFMIKAPVVISLLYALFTLLAQMCLLGAVGCGPVAVSSLFYSCGFIIPTVFGIICYNENFKWTQILGIGLVILSFVLSAKNTKDKKLSVKWLLFAIGGTVFSGLVGVCQKIFVKDYTAYSLDGFLCLSFLIMIVLSLFMLLICRCKKSKLKTNEKSVNVKILLLSSIVLGVIIGLANKVNTYLSGVFVSVISFPVINGGTIIFTALASFILLKEKLSVKQWIGIAVGFIAILFIAVI